MLRLTVLALCVPLMGVFSTNLKPRIVNGEPAALGQFPYQAALYINKNEYTIFCGGSLISEEWVLTAGQCVDGAKFAQVLTGLVEIEPTAGTFSESFYFILHEDYNPFTLSHDVGLLKLDRPLTFNGNMFAIRLASDSIGANVAVTVSGWGTTSDGSSAVNKNLNYVNLLTISSRECEDAYGTAVITGGIICAVSDTSTVKNPCLGDSGGPLVINTDSNPVHVGVVSFVSANGCESGEPSGYTSTGYYRDWIRKNSGV